MNFMEDNIIGGKFKFQSNQLTGRNFIENGFRARLIKRLNDVEGIPIEFILPEDERIFLGENKKVKIRMLSIDFIAEEVKRNQTLYVCFSINMILGEFIPGNDPDLR